MTVIIIICLVQPTTYLILILTPTPQTQTNHIFDTPLSPIPIDMHTSCNLTYAYCTKSLLLSPTTFEKTRTNPEKRETTYLDRFLSFILFMNRVENQSIHNVNDTICILESMMHTM